MINKGCIVKGCDNSHYGRGLCRKHYSRLYRNTHPEYLDYLKKKSKEWRERNPVKWRKICRAGNKRYRERYPELYRHYQVQSDMRRMERGIQIFAEGGRRTPLLFKQNRIFRDRMLMAWVKNYKGMCKTYFKDEEIKV